MAITLSDFDNIWASSSPLTPYSFTDANYKEGWNFIGATPPSRQMWDFLQKNNDEKAKYIVDNYLALSGGTMTGKVGFLNGGWFADYSNGMYVGGDAENKTNISRLILYTNDNASGFIVQAGNGSVDKKLIGKPDGTLTWNGQSIPERAYGVPLQSTAGQDTHTFNISTNGAVIFAKRGNNCAVYMVTYWDSGSTKIFSTGTEPISITKSSNSTSVTITNVNGNAVALKILNGGTL